MANRGEGVGNFWVDMTRTTLWVLLPLSAILCPLSIVLAGLGVDPDPAGLSRRDRTLEGGSQTLSLFPTASQLAIKQLGINGGGIFNVNSAHPFENPTPLTNLLTAISINMLGWAAFFAFGRTVLARKDVRALAIAALVLLSLSARAPCMSHRDPAGARPSSRPVMDASGQYGGQGSTRFGVPASVVWAVQTTGASNVARSTPCTPATCRWAGALQMFLMQLGEILPGGIGSGIAIMVVMAVLSVFVAGLMVGRTRRSIWARRSRPGKSSSP